MDLSRKQNRLPLGARMKELREAHGYTQTQCGDALGIAWNTYAQMESGACRFRRRDLVTLAVLYGLAPEEAFPSFFVGKPVAA